MSQGRRQLTYANVMATLAVFIAIGGSSYAALTISGKNVKNGSLTGADLKNSSLTGADVKNSSLGSVDIKDGNLLAKDFKAGQLPAGAQGPKGDTGAQGPPGEQGPKGDPGVFPETLQSGMTVRGVWAIQAMNENTVAGDGGADSVSFDVQLPSTPFVVIVPANNPPTTNCPGDVAHPAARGGVLCVYIRELFNISNISTYDPANGVSPGASRYGTSIIVTSSTTGQNFAYAADGTWAVTAP